MKLKLKPIKKVNTKVQQKEEPKQRKKQENTLPPDEYKPMFPPQRILVRETPSKKGGVIKQYLELSVKRFDDEEAPTCVWIQMYQESDFYTGYLKGKTVYLPLEMLYDLIDGLSELSDEAEERGIV